MNLHGFQKEFVAEYEAKIAAGTKRVLGVAPTGTGKTVIAGEIVRRAVDQSRRVVFIAHRDELLTQARRKLARFGIQAGIIKSGRDNDQRPQALVQICGIQTLHVRAVRLQTMELPPAALLIIDEAHHVRARTYRQIIEAYPDAIVLGLTATPCRTDGRGLGNCFDVIIECPQIAELTPKYLAPARIFTVPEPDLRGVSTAKTGDYVISQLEDRMNTDALVGDVVEHWLKHAQRRRTIVYAVDVAHSVHLQREFVRSGVKAEHLDGNTPQADRDAILSRLASGETEVICNCMVLTEGFDCPDVGCTALVRPTKSFELYRQMIGRGLRTADGKADCIILDHGGCVRRHGRPDDRIDWTLHTDKRPENKAHETRKAEYNGDPFCDCKQCGQQRVKGFACDNCGYQPKPRGESIDYVDDNLVELGNTQRQEIDRVATYRELRGYAADRVTKSGQPYSPKWAAHKFKEKFGYFPPWAWNDFSPIEPSDATLRWIRSRNIAYAKKNTQAARLAGLDWNRVEAFRAARSVSVQKLLREARDIKRGKLPRLTEAEIDQKIDDLIRCPDALTVARGIELREKRKTTAGAGMDLSNVAPLDELMIMVLANCRHGICRPETWILFWCELLLPRDGWWCPLIRQMVPFLKAR